MASLPYITSAGNIDKALATIKTAPVPERVSQDFVKTILKIPGGSGDQMTAFLKKINFAASDGKPTELYTKFRNPTSSGQAVAQAIRHAYAPLYTRNEFMHKLNDNELLGLIVEETGQAHDSNPVKLAYACIKALKKHATFNIGDISSAGAPEREEIFQRNTVNSNQKAEDSAPPKTGSIGLNLGYTINLNLPATTNPEVFNAIFKSLKENLLRDDDA